MLFRSQDGLWESSDYVTFQKIATPPASDPNAFMPVPMQNGFNSDGMASMEAYNGAIWCGSSTSGKVYKVDIATSVPGNPVPSSKINRIFPNPFVTATTIYMTKPLVNATMTIYSSLGKEVKLIKNINGNTFTFDRGHLPAGLYYIQLNQNNRIIASDKMIIID